MFMEVVDRVADGRERDAYVPLPDGDALVAFVDAFVGLVDARNDFVDSSFADVDARIGFADVVLVHVDRAFTASFASDAPRARASGAS